MTPLTNFTGDAGADTTSAQSEAAGVTPPNGVAVVATETVVGVTKSGDDETVTVAIETSNKDNSGDSKKTKEDPSTKEKGTQKPDIGAAQGEGLRELSITPCTALTLPRCFMAIILFSNLAKTKTILCMFPDLAK